MNICNEVSVLEGNSVQLDKNVDVAVATSFSSLSGPAGLSSSRVPAEVAVFPEPKHSRTPPFSGGPKNNSLVVVVVFLSFA